MSIPKSSNSYHKSQMNSSSRDIDMPPVGYVLGDEKTPTVIAPAQQEFERQTTKQALSALDNEPVQYEAQQEDQEVQDQSYEQDTVEDEQEVEQVAPRAKTKDDNIRAMREKSDRIERERDMLMAKMIEMQAQQQQYQPKVAPVKEVEDYEDDLDFDMGEDDLVDGKTVRRVADRIKNLERRLKQQSYQSKEIAVEAKIKANFPDFDKVVSVENVQRLNEEFPEVAMTLRDTADIYNKAASAYKIMKKFGIHKELYASDRQKAITNSNKPRPLTSVSPQQGDSPLSKANAFANGMTEELKAQLRKEMQAARKSL